MKTTDSVLEFRNLTKKFGGITAVNDVTVKVAQGSIVGLIGPNGAGKTTLVDLISGNIKPTTGQVIFQGQDITNTPAHLIARMGLSRTFQIVQPFSEMTVLENVMAGALYAGHAKTRRKAQDAAMEHLQFTGLDKFADSPAAELSLANRKRLELSKSLAMNPTLLMLDEVNAGLNSSEIADAMKLIQRIADRGVTIIIIEHLMRIVAALSSRIIVLHHGAMLCDDVPEAVFKDERVIEAYLGSKFANRHTEAAAKA
jgi:branched-chain amino acid transport system ATP-binding protein